MGTGCLSWGWRWPPTSTTAGVKERVELYLYSSSAVSRTVHYVNRRKICQVPSFYFCSFITLFKQLNINPLTPDDPYIGRTAPLTSKRCILYIYSTSIGTEYFKYGINSPFFPSSKGSLFYNSNVFGSCIILILYIYSTNIGTEYFKHGINSPFFLFKMQFVS